MSKFWMVFGGHRTNPTKIYETQQEAIDEAERLCRHQGNEFFVMEAVKVARALKPPIETIDL